MPKVQFLKEHTPTGGTITFKKDAFALINESKAKSWASQGIVKILDKSKGLRKHHSEFMSQLNKDSSPEEIARARASSEGPKKTTTK